MHEGDGFLAKPLGKSRFHFQTDWSSHVPAGQFCQMECALRFRIPWSVVRITKPKIHISTNKSFPDSGIPYRGGRYRKVMSLLYLVVKYLGPSELRSPGVLPYMGYIGMCHCQGYGFQAVKSGIGYIIRPFGSRLECHFPGNWSVGWRFWSRKVKLEISTPNYETKINWLV